MRDPTDPGSPKSEGSMIVMTSFDLLLSFLLSYLSLAVQASSKELLILSWGLFGSTVSHQDDPRDRENLDLSLDIENNTSLFYCLKNIGKKYELRGNN